MELITILNRCGTRLLGSAVMLRVYDIEGTPVNAAVRFLGKNVPFTETNLLEEEVSTQVRTLLQAGPNTIRTLRLRLP